MAALTDISKQTPWPRSDKGRAVTGLQAAWSAVRSGLWLGIFEGVPNQCVELPLPSDCQFLDVYFFLRGELSQEIGTLPGGHPREAPAQAEPKAEDWVLLSPSQGEPSRLSLRGGCDLRMILLRLLPPTAGSLLGEKATLLVPLPGYDATEANSPVPRGRMVGCSAAMKACLGRLYQHREPENWRRVYRQSLVLQLIYMLVKVCGSGDPDGNLSQREKQRLQVARHILDCEYASPPGLAELAARCELSEHKLKKGFKALYANTVYGYVTEQRMETAKMLLSEGTLNVDAASWEVGYSNVSHFITAFRRHFGINPGCYKRDLLERMFYEEACTCECPCQAGARPCSAKSAA